MLLSQQAASRHSRDIKMAGVTPRFARLSDDELAELEHEIVKPCRVFEYFMDLNVFLGGNSKKMLTDNISDR